MKRNTERILTTHTGSLPRPAALAALLVAREKGEDFDPLSGLQQFNHDIVRRHQKCDF